MNTRFHINNYIINEPAQLFIEIGENNIAFTILQGNTFTVLASYTFAQAHEVETLLNTETLLQNSFSKIDIVYSNKHCVLVPPAFYNAPALNTHIELIYGKTMQSPIKSDFLFRHNIHTVYQVDNTVSNIIAAKFPFAITHHIYSLLPDVCQLKGNKLFVIFYQQKCIVLCCKENKLQLIQQFEFSTPEDEAYYLLSVAHQHLMNVDEINLQIGGMIDNESSLYIELYKYFRHIEFAELNSNFDYCDEIKNLPLHYFSPLLSVAACV